MHASRIALLIAALAGMVCTFLPWASVPLLGSVYGTRGDGWISFVVCVGALLVSLIGNRVSALSTAGMILSTICGVAAALVGLVDLINLNQRLAENPFGDAVSIGPGLYLLIVAGVAIAVVPPLLSLRAVPAPPHVMVNQPPPQQYWGPQPPPPQGHWQPQQQPGGWPPNY